MPRKKNIVGHEGPIERTKLYNIPTIELAKAFIERDPAAHYDIPVLADKVGINEFQLKQGFRELFQTSPYQYRLQLCLQKEKELLEDIDNSIDQIAARVGFETYNKFSISFKKEFLIALTQYRNNNSRLTVQTN